MSLNKISFAFICFATLPITLNAQDESEKESGFFLKTDTTWRKELFTFPLGFAQEIPYTGLEDARFPVGWEHIESPNFWSYAFAWSIEDKKSVTEKELEMNLKLYFDGLMEITSNSNKTDVTTTTVGIHPEVNSNEVRMFSGKLTTFDRFFTKKKLTLNILVEHHYCHQNNKSIILFRFSPKAFDDAVWPTLKSVKLEHDVCEL